ncbi:aldolase/citrate lyase family protein [Nocardioides sp. WS12]|uniref:aldolase/citrate lyase family protein n=1 Tax=Nocardioides sp. WS12 TaxID=2486272 RepID=UPI0015FE4C9B|nr:aldolase/citrate lyase family protein [Nocardioides sp. WS12]
MTLDGRRLLGSADTRRGLWLTFLSPFGLEVAERAAPIDWIGVDLQHGDIDLTDLSSLVRASRLPVYARAASQEATALTRIVDTGVHGLIVPGVDSADQARVIVDAVRLPPVGRRSSGLARATVLGTDAPVVLAMIETRAGLDAVHEIAEVAGIDGLFVGPYDLSLSLGESSLTSEPMLSAITTAVEEARRHEKLAAAFAGDPELAGLLPPLDLLGVDSDATALRLGLAELFAASSLDLARTS